MNFVERAEQGSGMTLTTPNDRHYFYHIPVLQGIFLGLLLIINKHTGYQRRVNPDHCQGLANTVAGLHDGLFLVANVAF